MIFHGGANIGSKLKPKESLLTPEVLLLIILPVYRCTEKQNTLVAGIYSVNYVMQHMKMESPCLRVWIPTGHMKNFLTHILIGLQQTHRANHTEPAISILLASIAH